MSKTAGTTAAAVDSVGHEVVKAVAGVVSTAAGDAVSNMAHANTMAICIHGSECGRNQQGFGWLAVSLKPSSGFTEWTPYNGAARLNSIFHRQSMSMVSCNCSVLKCVTIFCSFKLYFL